MLRVRSVMQTCDACPTQWEGRSDDDRPVYARYRFGRLLVRIGPPQGDIDSAVTGEVVVGLDHGDELDGTLTYDELVQLTMGQVRWPAFAERGQAPLIRHALRMQPKAEPMEFLTFDRGFEADPLMRAMLRRVERGEERLYQLRPKGPQHDW